MIIIENISTFGFETAMRGMRNAKNSWRLNDTVGDVIGPNDLKLLLQLTTAGKSHRKALRMMHIQMDVTAPLYWWKDYDTYKVSTVANSCSTMHKIHDRDLTIDDFSIDQLDMHGRNLLSITIDTLNQYRRIFLDSGMKDRGAWYSMIQLLPNSYMQKRTLDINYEVALSISLDRHSHKLEEFRELVKSFKTELPYMNQIVEASRYE